MRKDIVLIVISLILLIYSLILTIENWEIMTRLEIGNPEFLKAALTGTIRGLKILFSFKIRQADFLPNF